MTKILIADDDPGILESMSALLEMYDYETVSVRDADEILPALREARPDVLLQDVNMPGLDLDAHMQAVHAESTLADLTVILFTGDSAAADIVDRVGAQGSLPKPFDPEDLQKLLAQAQT